MGVMGQRFNPTLFIWERLVCMKEDKYPRIKSTVTVCVNRNIWLLP